MHRIRTQSLLALIVLGSLVHAMAAGPIGVAMANGASVFDGAEVKTGGASSRLRMNTGAKLEIGTDSQAKIYAGRMVLERGAGQVESASPYGLEARTLRIVAEAKSIARVQLDGPDTVVVSAVNGPVRVSTASGVLVARLSAGRNFRFQPQAAAANAFEVSGCLLKKNGQFVLVDQTTTQMFELRGTDLNAQLGNRISVKASGIPGAQPAAEGAAQVIQVQSMTAVAPGGCLATAASVGADPLPGTSVRQTVPEVVKHGPNKAVIAGVVIAGGAAAGLAVALGSKSKSP